MFGSNNKKKEASRTGSMMPSAKSHSLNSLVQGTSVEGTIVSQSDIRIDGKIKGTLNCSAKVIVGPTGHIEGDITCQNAVIEGTIVGHIIVKELLVLKETASLDGKVNTKKLSVQSGAIFTGTCVMDDTTKKAKTNGRVSKKEAEKVLSAVG